MEKGTPQDKESYGEFSGITHIDWHAHEHGMAAEIENITTIEKFLTNYFKEAKAKALEGNKDALIQYFKAWTGVGPCLEGRARCMVDYIMQHPTLEDQEIVRELAEVGNYNSDDFIDTVFDLELAILGTKTMKDNRLPEPMEFKIYLEGKGIFKMEFKIDKDKKDYPTLERLHKFILQKQDESTMSYYQWTDFLQVEHEIFQTSNNEQTEQNFLDQLARRQEYAEQNKDWGDGLIKCFFNDQETALPDILKQLQKSTPVNSKIGIWTVQKLPRLADRKSLNISNMKRLAIGQSRGFDAAEIPISEFT